MDKLRKSEQEKVNNRIRLFIKNQGKNLTSKELT